MHRSVSRAPKGLKLFVDIADEPNSAVFYLDHLMASAYLSGADGYFVYGEPGNPNQPPAININGVEISGYYQDQGTMVDDGGLEEAMRGMTMVEGNGDSAVGSSELLKAFQSLSFENAAPNPASAKYPEDYMRPPPSAPTFSSFESSPSSGWHGKVNHMH